nr:MAG TPA: hypothetical protein [Caudoviricetes sp.]
MYSPFVLINIKTEKFFEFNAHNSNIIRNFAISIITKQFKR